MIIPTLFRVGGGGPGGAAGVTCAAMGVASSRAPATTMNTLCVSIISVLPRLSEIAFAATSGRDRLVRVLRLPAAILLDEDDRVAQTHWRRRVTRLVGVRAFPRRGEQGHIRREQ